MPVAEADAEAAAAAAAAATVGASPSARNDDSTAEAADRLVASPPSTPTTATSPVSPTFLSVAGRVSTPLSLFVDSAPSSGKKKKKLLSPSSPTSPGSESAAELRRRYLAMSPTASGGARDGEAMLAEAERMRQRALQVEQQEQEHRQQERKRGREGRQQEQEQNQTDETDWREKSTGTGTGADAGTGTGPPLPWSPSSSTSISTSNLDSNIAASASSVAGDTDQHDSGRSRGVISAPLPQSPNARARRGQHERSTAARDSDIATITGHPALSANSGSGGNHTASPGGATARIPAPEDAPLHTGSVQPGTKLAHPKPILHIATDVSSPSRLSHHHDLLTRSASAVSNVAHLEATAERLSMTSSIDDAIRELHCELKRSDSRRSSLLAARAASASADDSNANPNPNSTTRLRRHPSNSNSTSSAAAAARQRGYHSPAYVMSPTSSLSGRMRSGSNASAGRPEHDAINTILSRHGPGKSSVRSVRSAKPSLAEISESEPISLTQHVLDQVDTVPPAEQHAAASSRSIIEQDAVRLPHTDDFHDMLEGGFRSHRASNLVLVNPDLPSSSDYDEHEHDRDAYDDRPMTANSTNTFQVAQDAFVDFDGAHCETDTEDDRFASTTDMGAPSHKRERLPDMHQHQHQQPPPPQLPQSYSQSLSLPPILDDDHLPTPQPLATDFVRPHSYFDEQTGQHMLYYPARVPAMLNLPPKLSNKPKAADRNQRRSQLLGAMMQPKEAKRKSVVPDLDKFALPDPLSGHRNSFAALSVADGLGGVDDATTPTGWFEEAAAQVGGGGGGDPPSLEDLRQSQRLSKMDNDKHKSTGGLNLPPHLRASVFFEQPSEAPEIEVKDGSAMATLDSILDASATAPVSAFTDHLYAGKLGSEVYGKAKKKKTTTTTKKKETKRKSQQLDVPSAESGPKEKSTIKLLTKRSQSSLFGKASSNPDPSAMHGDGHAVAHEEDEEEEEEEESEEEEEQLNEGILDGVPTTLLGELHLRKQQQKQRVLNNGNVASQGMRATLLEMDAVAEMQRKQRLKSRVNLAWEDQAAAAEHNLSDDEDVPLAVIAALHQGAKNMADVERPLGLMEVRQLEENEPLSQRAARLKGRTSIAVTAKRQSNLSLPATRIAEVQPPAPSPRIVGPDVGADEDARTTTATEPGPLAPEIEEETLGARKRRLAESQLPKARPVSSTFSMELLSQFGGPDEFETKSSGKKSPNNLGVEDETLGQRRRRLQAEREAREREMSYGNLTGERPASYGNPTNLSVGKGLARRVSMADMLSVHQNIQDPRIEEQRRQQQEQMRIAEQDARMAAVRAQMPTALIQPGNARTGGFKGGLYNDGTGGLGLEAARSSVALNALQTRSFTNTGPRNRATMMAPPTGYGMPQGGLQPSFSTMTGFNGVASGMNTMSVYGAGNLYGANGLINQGIPMSNPNGSMDRVERWRQGVFP